MSIDQFLIVYVSCLVTMLICRCAPMMLMKGKDLPESVTAALNLIPPAAFAALVANDLFKPTMFDGGIMQGAVPLLAALIVVIVAKKTHSLIACALSGVIAYAALLFIV